LLELEKKTFLRMDEVEMLNRVLASAAAQQMEIVICKNDLLPTIGSSIDCQRQF